MKGLTLLELLIIVVIVGLLLVVLLPHLPDRAYVPAKITTCGSNLSQMVKAMYNYCLCKMASCPNHPAPGTGGDWWLMLYSSGEIADPAYFWCPLRTEGVEWETYYRGPARDARLVSENHIWICDRPTNHALDEPVNAVTRAGEGVTFRRGTANFEKAMAETTD